jgi:YidC/Oxa1 family membrane protein insertase
MMKMQKMGPEFERLKKKHGDDKEAFTKAQMQLYKEMGFTPFLGCLPMFLQMPIWFALYSALQNEYELRQAPFLWGWTWIHDLARPDRLITWDAHSFTIPLIGLKIAALNILPLLMAVVFFMQQKYTPKPPATSPEQQTQQKMMQWMTLLFPLFLYSAPSGLNLYILTSTGMGVLESKRIRDHIKQREEDEKNQRVTVDTKLTRQGKQNKKQELAEKEQAKPGWLGGLWARLQEKAEEVRRDAEKRNGKK